MATVTVQNTITDDSGAPIKGAQVLITLVTAATTQPGYTTSSTIEGTLVVTTDNTGTWTANLTPNANITPANTYYRVTENNYWQSTIVVPASGGPYQLSAVLSTPPPTPAAPGITGVQVAVSGAVTGVRPEVNLIPGSNITLTAADNPTNNRVDVTVNSAAGGVTSVNGQTGPAVNLTAANVGAVATSGNETIAGTKTFSSAPVVPAAAFPESAVSGLATDLSARTVYRGAWAGSTVYAVNDLATIGGELLVCRTAHTSGSTFSLTNWTCLTSKAGVYNIRLYGAQGDGVTDDTTAVRNAISAAYSWGTSGGAYGATIYAPPGEYLLASAPVQGGTTKGNAQLALPVDAVTGQSFSWLFAGPQASTKPWHWQQTATQTGGTATFISTWSGTNDATYGEVSILGGPTPAQGYGQASALFSNTYLVVDGINFVYPNDPHICGVDAVGLAASELGAVSIRANATPSTVSAATQTWQFAYRAPDNGNNDHSRIRDLTVQGAYVGAYVNEHTVTDRVTAVYNVAAVEVGRGSDTSHGATINYISAESCQVGIGAVSGSFPCKVLVRLMDWEVGSGSFAPFCIVNDGSNRLFGDIGITSVGVSNHLTSGTGNYGINGASNMRVWDLTRQAGNAGPLAAPTSGVVTLNPFFRDAWVQLSVTGGSISSVVVDSQTLAGAPVAVFVPTNKNITVTYTGTLSWTWTLQ